MCCLALERGSWHFGRISKRSSVTMRQAYFTGISAPSLGDVAVRTRWPTERLRDPRAAGAMSGSAHLLLRSSATRLSLRIPGFLPERARAPPSALRGWHTINPRAFPDQIVRSRRDDEGSQADFPLIRVHLEEWVPAFTNSRCNRIFGSRSPRARPSPCGSMKAILCLPS